MKRTLYIKILAGYLLFAICAFVVLFTFTERQFTKSITQQEARKMYRESILLSSQYKQLILKDLKTTSEQQAQLNLLSSYLSADIWVINMQGDIICSSSLRNANIQSSSKAAAQFDVSDFGNQFFQIGHFYDCFSEDTLTVFSQISSNYKVVGYVLIHKPVSSLTPEVSKAVNISFFTLLILFLCAFFILGAFTLFVYLPLRRITRVVDKYNKGDFSQQISLHTNDELSYVAATLNFMANELSTREEDQRKFISNVSHDFRSPLTSIKGYVEAMLDGTIPPELQEKYLNIIVFETERLNKLTQSLIDLNQFGHRGIMLDITDFDINQMIRTTILTFEGTCAKKGLTFDLVLTGQELYVTADMGKIQQVIYNLIDNASKFSHNDTSIKIETSVKNEKTLISVRDNGIGIPADSISKIWDRFYKTDLSRGKDKRGSGLGLAIVKEIITAHHEHINVVSTEGAGSEFIFTLPLSHKEK